VFNLAQVTTGRACRPTGSALPGDARIAAADAFCARLPGLGLRHGSTAAFYCPSSDHVQLPPFADFRDALG
jgi:antirestriction protein ArdC